MRGASFHAIVHLVLVIVACVDNARSVTATSRWMNETASNEGLDVSSGTTRRNDEDNETITTTSQTSLFTEESIFFPPPASSSMSDDRHLIDRLVESNFAELIDDNAIDHISSGDYDKQQQADDKMHRLDAKHHDNNANNNNNNNQTEEPEIPECQSVAEEAPSPSAYYNSNRLLLAGEKPPEETTESVPVTTERAKDVVEMEDFTIEDSKLSDSLTVSWKRPSSAVNVTSYRVEWCKEKALECTCQVTKQTEIHKIVIPSLSPCKSYTVKVTPYMANETGLGREVTGTTGLNVTKDRLNLRIESSTTDSMKISWNMPNSNCVSYYLVTVCQGKDCTDAKINITTFTKAELSPCLTYDFNLTVWGMRYPYGSVNVTGTTEFLEPGQPSSAATIPGNHTLTVTWLKPQGHTCAKFYRLTWTHNGKSKTAKTSDTSMELKNLEACAVYEIVIVTVWDGGESQQERIHSQKTVPDVTDPPVALEKPSVGKDKISIKWLINTNETNNCGSIILIVACTVDKTFGKGYTSANGSAQYHIDAETRNVTWDTSVKDLGAFTRYVCRSVTFNAGGRSPGRSLPIVATTLEDVPSAPELIPGMQSNVTNSSITLMWKKPAYLPGKLTNFTIQVIWEYQLHRPIWCTENITMFGTENITIPDGDATSYEYAAMPKTHYRMKIVASTGAGPGSVSKPEVYLTTPGAPTVVTNFSYTMTDSVVDPNVLDVIISWGIPCRVNADNIEFFYVSGSGGRDNFPEHAFTYKINYTKDCYTNDTCKIRIHDLREEYYYKIRIATKVTGYDDLGEASELPIRFPAGIPPPPDENYTSLISIDPLKARRTTTTATVLLPIFPDAGGTIRCYAIIVAKRGYNNGSYGRFDSNSSCPHTASWKESMLVDFVVPYQAVKFCTDSYPSFVADYGRLKAIKFVLGEDSETCLKLSSNSDERSYCNGPLNPDTWYDVRMRAFTDGGYRDSTVFTVKTNAKLQVALVIGTIFGILFLGILTTMMLLVRKCSLQVVLRRFLHSDMPGSPVPTPFTRRKFIVHCQQLADNPGKLSNEYQLLQTLSVDLQMPTNAAGLQANRKKNRYTDILPYDFSRVKLEVIDNDPNTDYINASFIKGFSGEEDYIACQGPKEETTYDFWRMIDQYNVKIIVMLTQLVEKNKEKCHQYFPTIRETFTYENMAIRCTSELDYKTYTHRSLVLEKANEKRNIIHLHFKDWPDHDVPEEFDAMINFCQIMRRHMNANRGLVVVHCSAGIGRTGTLIAIDILLQHIKENRKLDVFGTVYRLRHHRINMVQRESQYAYIYNCIKQVLKNPYFSKSYKPPSVDPIFDNNSHKKKETSDSSTNLVSSLETLKKSSFSTSVESAEPIYQRSSELAIRTCYPFNGLRCAKSTSAIDTGTYPKIIGRYNTHDHPIFDRTRDSSEIVKSSDISFEISDESEGSTTSSYENMQPLLRTKSAQDFADVETNSRFVQQLFECDTPL